MGVSEFIKKEVEHHLMDVKDNSGTTDRREFNSSLFKTLLWYIVFGIVIALTAYLGYLLGTNFDSQYEVFPLWTILGTFLGIGVAGLTGFSIIQKYFIMGNKPAKTVHLQDIANHYPSIDITIDQVRNAVREFSDRLPKGVYRTILVMDGNRIDLEPLAPILGGIPTNHYYMSKETYDIFEENEKEIPVQMDLVQKAVDQYVKENKEYPMLPFDPDRRVNYFQLTQGQYLKSPPDIQFYITDLDGLITHKKPENNGSPPQT